jgi:hypothetical protein
MEEQRRHTRLDALNLLHFVLRDERGGVLKQGMGRTLNVSESGILLESYTPIDQQRELFVAIGLEERIAELRGTVVHRVENAVGAFEYGIAFQEPNASQLSILREYIDAFMHRAFEGRHAPH